MGYSHELRGVGLGFGGSSYSAAPPPKSLLRQCMQANKGVEFGSALQRPSAAPQPPQQQQPKRKPAAAPAAPAATMLEGTNSVLTQWVSVVHGASSQFSASEHAARQLLGESTVYPSSESNPKAWSAVPRPGETLEWVRVGFKKAVHPTAVVVYETLHPGSIVSIRGAAQPKGSRAEASDWIDLWSGRDAPPADPLPQTARLFSPPLHTDALGGRLVSALEIALDTSSWGVEFWSEIDCIRLEGTEPPPKGRGSIGAAVVLVGGGPSPDTWLDRMPWETDRAFAARARFEAAKFGPSPPASGEEGMRRAAISMAHSNMTILGCTYPAAVQAEAGGGRDIGPGGASSSGMAVEGELRSAGAQTGV
jgi:hypothetical protein